MSNSITRPSHFRNQITSTDLLPETLTESDEEDDDDSDKMILGDT